MKLRTQRNCHALYNLEYHLILVTKFRKPAINDEVFETIRAQVEKLAEASNVIVEEINHDTDHIHLLFSAPPQVCLSQFVNSVKSTTSRMVRRDHAEFLKRFYWKPLFWSRSYMILSSGGAPIDVIRRYIQEQADCSAGHKVPAGSR